MSTICVTGCARPAHNALLCRTCSDELHSCLREVIAGQRPDAKGNPSPSLASELLTTLARLDKAGTGIGTLGHHGTTGLPWGEHASNALRTLRTVLVGWVRDLWETNPCHVLFCSLCGVQQLDHAQGPTQEPREWDKGVQPLDCEDTLEAMAAWLLRHPTWMSMHPAADELHRQITGAVSRARWAIDRAPDRLYCGPCYAPISGDDTDLCQEDLYGRPDDAYVTCRACGAQHDLVVRRAWLLEQARGQLMPAPDIARGLSALRGHHLAVSQIHVWHHRGKLAQYPAHPQDQLKRPRYKVGEVEALMHELVTRKAG